MLGEKYLPSNHDSNALRRNRLNAEIIRDESLTYSTSTASLKNSLGGSNETFNDSRRIRMMLGNATRKQRREVLIECVDNDPPDFSVIAEGRNSMENIVTLNEDQREDEFNAALHYVDNTDGYRSPSEDGESSYIQYNPPSSEPLDNALSESDPSVSSKSSTLYRYSEDDTDSNEGRWSSPFDCRSGESEENQGGLMKKLISGLQEIARDPFMIRTSNTNKMDDLVSPLELESVSINNQDGEQDNILVTEECNEGQPLGFLGVGKVIEPAPSDTEIEVSAQGSIEFLQVNGRIISIRTSPSIPTSPSSDSTTQALESIPANTQLFKKKSKIEKLRKTLTKLRKTCQCTWIKTSLFLGHNPYIPQRHGWSEDYNEYDFGTFYASTESSLNL